MKATVQERDAHSDVTDLPLALRLRPVLELTEDQFFELCQLNRDLRIERNAEGELLIMPPAGGATGGREAEITTQLQIWTRRDGTGMAFSPSTGFRLPNGAVRAPDAAWMPRSRLAAIPPAQFEKFIPACPDFVIELRSPSDTLQDLRDKLQEYIDNGARLGWLIVPRPRRVYVYRPDAPVELLDQPERVSGDPVLPGFVLDLREIW